MAQNESIRVRISHRLPKTNKESGAHPDDMRRFLYGK
jgi:hypothetical protein